MSKYGEDIAEIKNDVKWILKVLESEHEVVEALGDRVTKIEKKLAWYAGAIATISTALSLAADSIKNFFIT